MAYDRIALYYNSSGVEQWTFDHGDRTWRGIPASDGYLYVVSNREGPSGDGYTVTRKLALSDGVEDTDFRFRYSESEPDNRLYCIAIGP